MNRILQETGGRVLAFGAHPDDLEVYMGGTLIVLVKGGARLRAVVATDGERGTLQPLHGTRRDEHPRSITAIEVVHRVTGRGIDPRALAEAIRLSDTKYCSVHATLIPGVSITSRHEIVEEA